MYTCRSSAVTETRVDGQLLNQAFNGLMEQSAARQLGPWTHELHTCFVECVNRLGGPALATPMHILGLMPGKGLTIARFGSHLQLYRQYMAR